MRTMNDDPYRKIVTSPNFERWFGDSKVVDADGAPLLVYHGTTQSFDVFDPAKVGSNCGYDKQGFHFTDDRLLARCFSRTAEENSDPHMRFSKEGHAIADARIAKAYLSIRNPLTKAMIAAHPEFKQVQYFCPVDFFDNNRALIEKLWHGHDGVILNKIDGRSVYVAFNPEQIKIVGRVGRELNSSAARDSCSLSM